MKQSDLYLCFFFYDSRGYNGVFFVMKMPKSEIYFIFE